MNFLFQQCIMENGTVKKPVKIIIALQPETIENCTIKNYYDLFLKIGVLLLAHMLKNLETNPEILLNKINYDFLKLEQKSLLSQQRKTTKKIVRVSFRRRKI